MTDSPKFSIPTPKDVLGPYKQSEFRTGGGSAPGSFKPPDALVVAGPPGPIGPSFSLSNDEFELVANGLIASGQAPTNIGNLEKDHIYRIYIAASDDDDLLVLGDIDEKDDIIPMSQSGDELEPLIIPAANKSVHLNGARGIEFRLFEKEASTDPLKYIAALSSNGQDTAVLEVLKNGNVRISHSNGGDDSNGMYMVTRRPL